MNPPTRAATCLAALVLTLAGCGTVGGAVILEPWQDPHRAARWAPRCGLTQLHLSVEHVRRDPTVVADLHAMGLAVAGTDSRP